MNKQIRRCVLSVLDRVAPIVPIPDKAYLRIKYYCRMGKRLHLKNPSTFNEKLQWLKLYGRKPIDTILSDKFAVKEYIAKTLGDQYIIPVLGVWDRFEDIDFDRLPDQFVLKCTHDSGGIVICKDKTKLDKVIARKKLNKSLKTDYFVYSREHAYKNIPRRIIAEKYMEDSSNLELMDYKVHNFNGIPKLILLCQSRFSKGGLREDFYSTDWEHLDICRPGHPNADERVLKPAKLNEILELSAKIAKGMPFVRTDFYIINGKVFFGEVTYSPAGGMTPFIPEEWDKVLGDWIILPDAGKK